MKIAVIPGSFDPLTVGHVNIIERASLLFDEIHVVVGINKKKDYLFSVEDRIKMIKKSLSHLNNVTVTSYPGLIVSYCRNVSAQYIVKGLRDSTDFSYEHELEINNKYIAPEIETVYFTSKKDNNFIRSSSVKTFLDYGVDVKDLVPYPVYEEILKLIKK